MCGIVVSKSVSVSLDEGAKRIISRGPDQQRQLVNNHYQFYFNRLAIMGLDESGMQPFMLAGDVLVANAEIYNEEALKLHVKNYMFTSGSDCEVLLPLYRQFGFDMFHMLDAEFAIVIYDHAKKCFVAGRDPLGIRPLFYGFDAQDDIVFASEVKAIIDIVKKVYPFPPGHYYDGKSFVRYHMDWVKMPTKTYALDDIYQRINKLLSDAVVKRMHADAPIGFLLSGGLDSSLVCAIAQKHSNKSIRTFSIGMDTDPIDLKYARQVADYLKTEHEEIIMSKQDVINCLKEVVYALETYDITTIRASIGMYIISKYIHEKTDIKVLLTGEVSDELFGYKYTDYAPTPKAFQEEEIKRLNELYMYDVLRADRCLAANALEARVPFSDKHFVDYVVSIDPTIKMNTTGIGKYLLRKAFEIDYLPHNILYREKAAFSDAVGHSMVDHLKAYANQYYDDETFKTRSKRYEPTPISKEALLYRDIFEQRFKDHAHLVNGYWMPNASWNGCDVTDPSARYLKNYGNSGK